jgi:hypothetical protein
MIRKFEVAQIVACATISWPSESQLTVQPSLVSPPTPSAVTMISAPKRQYRGLGQHDTCRP